MDIAGSGGVHLVGGASAFTAAKYYLNEFNMWKTILYFPRMMGARLGRWDIPGDPPMGSPTNACVGLFMLWWGWLAFNAGSTFGEFLNDKTSELPNKVFLSVIDL